MPSQVVVGPAPFTPDPPPAPNPTSPPTLVIIPPTPVIPPRGDLYFRTDGNPSPGPGRARLYGAEIQSGLLPVPPPPPPSTPDTLIVQLNMHPASEPVIQNIAYNKWVGTILQNSSDAVWIPVVPGTGGSVEEETGVQPAKIRVSRPGYYRLTFRGEISCYSPDFGTVSWPDVGFGSIVTNAVEPHSNTVHWMTARLSNIVNGTVPVYSATGLSNQFAYISELTLRSLDIPRWAEDYIVYIPAANTDIQIKVFTLAVTNSGAGLDLPSNTGTRFVSSGLFAFTYLPGIAV